MDGRWAYALCGFESHNSGRSNGIKHTWVRLPSDRLGAFHGNRKQYLWAVFTKEVAHSEILSERYGDGCLVEQMMFCDSLDHARKMASRLGLSGILL